MSLLTDKAQDGEGTSELEQSAQEFIRILYQEGNKKGALEYLRHLEDDARGYINTRYRRDVRAATMQF